MQGCYLVVGLGNPGRTYQGTRHNMGFCVAKALGSKYGVTFKPALVSAKGTLGEGLIREKKTRILMPLTYMNHSGSAVKRCCHFYAIPTTRLLVVADDVSLPFGQLRLRSQGGGEDTTD